MATVLELTARLKEAEQAYHDLVSGVAPKVLVHQNGQRIEYNSTTRSALKSYIDELKRDLGQAGNYKPPMTVFF